MTAPGTLPTGVTRLDAPCWHLINQYNEPHDTGDGCPHYGSAIEAAANIDGLNRCSPPGWVWRAEQVDDLPCLMAACEGCGYQLDEDGAMTMHHNSVEEIEIALKSCEWKIGSSGVFCPECVHEDTKA